MRKTQKLATGEHFGVAKNKVQLKGVIFNEMKTTTLMDVPWHYHENAYFYFHLKGYLTEVNKKQTIECKKGTLLYHNSQDAHYNTKFEPNSNFYHIELEDKWFKKHDLKRDLIEGNLQIQTPTLKTIFNKLYLDILNKDSVTPISVDSLLLQAFSEILRKKSVQKQGIPSWAKKAKEILYDENNKDISLNWLATAINIHPVHLSRNFKKYFGTNLGDYLRRIKVEKAISLMKNNELNNTQIAFECGFSDESHFIKIFKQYYTITPANYRKKIIKS